MLGGIPRLSYLGGAYLYPERALEIHWRMHPWVSYTHEYPAEYKAGNKAGPENRYLGRFLAAINELVASFYASPPGRGYST